MLIATMGVIKGLDASVANSRLTSAAAPAERHRKQSASQFDQK